MASNELDDLSDLGAVPENSSDDLADLGAIPESSPLKESEERIFPTAVETARLAGESLFGLGRHAETAYETLSEPKDDLALLDQYKQVFNRKGGEIRAIQEQYPKTDFAVSALTGLAIPGGIAAKGLAKTASLATRIGSGTALGAGMGAAQQLGTSSAPVDIARGITQLAPSTTISGIADTATDVAKGAAVGGFIGGVIPAATGTVGSLLSAIKESQPAKLIGQAFKRGFTEGGEAFSKEGVRKAESKFGSEVENLGQEVFGIQKDLGGRLQQEIDTLEKAGKTVDISDDFAKTTEEIKKYIPFSSEEAAEKINLLRSLESDPLTKLQNEVNIFNTKATSEGSNLRQEILQTADISGKPVAIIRQLDTTPGAEKMKALKVIEIPLEENLASMRPQQLQTKIRQVQQYTPIGSLPLKTTALGRSLTNLVRSLRTKQESAITSKYHNISEVSRALGIDDILHSDELQLKNALSTVIQSAAEMGKTGLVSRQKLEHAYKNLAEINPEISENFKKNVDKIAEDLDISFRMGTFTAGGAVFAPVRFVQTLAGMAGAVTGGAARTGKAAIQGLEQVPPEIITNSAKKLVEKFGAGGKKLADILLQIAPKSETTRKAMLFTILQNPEYRRMLRDSEDSAEQEQQQE